MTTDPLVGAVVVFLHPRGSVLQREEDAVQEALKLWEERERARAELLAAVDEAEASLARGDGRAITDQSMRDLAREVKRRGR